MERSRYGGTRNLGTLIAWNGISCDLNSYVYANFSFGGKVECRTRSSPEDGEDDEHVAEDGGEAEAEQHAEQEDVLEARRHRHCEGRVVLHDSKWVSECLQILLQGPKKWSAKCDENSPSRSGQTSLATAVANFTKPRTSHFFDLCTDGVKQGLLYIQRGE